MSTFIIILIIILVIWLTAKNKEMERKDLESKGIKCPYCGSTSCNRVGAAFSHKKFGKNFKCNKCGAAF